MSAAQSSLFSRDKPSALLQMPKLEIVLRPHHQTPQKHMTADLILKYNSRHNCHVLDGAIAER